MKGFIAVENVCEFKKGDRVPEAKGKVWYEMYKYPPVKLEELVEEKPESKVEEPEPENKPKRSRRSRKKDE